MIITQYTHMGRGLYMDFYGNIEMQHSINQMQSTNLLNQLFQ